MMTPKDWLCIKDMVELCHDSYIFIEGGEKAHNDEVTKFFHRADIFYRNDDDKESSSIGEVCVLSLYQLCVKLLCTVYNLCNKKVINNSTIINTITHKTAMSFTINVYSESIENAVFDNRCKFIWGAFDITDTDEYLIGCRLNSVIIKE